MIQARALVCKRKRRSITQLTEPTVTFFPTQQSRNKSKNRKLAKTSGAHGGGVVETKARSSGAKR